MRHRLGVVEGATLNMLRTLGRADVPIDRLPQALVELAERHKEPLDRLRRLEDADPQLNKRRDVENGIRALLREVGLKVGVPSRKTFPARVRELAADDPVLASLTGSMLSVIEAMTQEVDRLTSFRLPTFWRRAADRNRRHRLIPRSPP